MGKELAYGYEKLPPKFTKNLECSLADCRCFNCSHSSYDGCIGID
ncbi:hypothetical protein [Candidatus Kuenenia stuttgartiensis]|nr:hypothetical protein [Candidatus Kuenenia stuttgartiensis]